MAKVRTSVTVTFADGRRETVAIRPVAVVAAERKYGEKLPRIEGSLFAVWHTIGRPEGSFDAWLATVDDMEEVSEHTAPPLAEGLPPEQ